MPIPASHGGQGPSCFDRVKMGFMMGMCVGMASGAIFGGFNCLRFGLRGRELISNVGKVMVQGGGTFGTFMAIGTGIRCWSILSSLPDDKKLHISCWFKIQAYVKSYLKVVVLV